MATDGPIGAFGFGVRATANIRAMSVGHTTGQSVGRTSTHGSQSRMAHSQGRNVAEWTSGKGERPEFWINLRNDVGLFSAHESGEHIGE